MAEKLKLSKEVKWMIGIPLYILFVVLIATVIVLVVNSASMSEELIVNSEPITMETIYLTGVVLFGIGFMINGIKIVEIKHYHSKK